MKTINDIKITAIHLSNQSYNFQPKLTPKLDAIATDFDQDIINQIVLWKVNRYAELDEETLGLLNGIDKNDTLLDKKLTALVMTQLLQTKGIRLAMASTILRFKNPNIYQIIDQRVYRIIYGEPMPKATNSIEDQIALYFEYLDKLKTVCQKHNIDFQLSDRILYDLDKVFNKDIKITY